MRLIDADKAKAELLRIGEGIFGFAILRMDLIKLFMCLQKRIYLC